MESGANSVDHSRCGRSSLFFNKSYCASDILRAFRDLAHHWQISDGFGLHRHLGPKSDPPAKSCSSLSD